METAHSCYSDGRDQQSSVAGSRALVDWLCFNSAVITTEVNLITFTHAFLFPDLVVTVLV